MGEYIGKQASDVTAVEMLAVFSDVLPDAGGGWTKYLGTHDAAQMWARQLMWVPTFGAQSFREETHVIIPTAALGAGGTHRYRTAHYLEGALQRLSVRWGSLYSAD